MVMTLFAIMAILPATPGTAQITNDRLCQAIGDTPDIAVPPRDRAFFEDNCFCAGGTCKYLGPRRLKAIRARRAEAETCTAEVRPAVANELDQDLAPNGQLPDPELEASAYALCIEHRSAKRVTAELVRSIREQKRRNEQAAVEVAKREERRHREQQQRLPGVRTRIVEACRAFRACMSGEGNCWRPDGPGRDYEAACEEFSKIAGGQPPLCANKTDDTCSW